MEQPEPDIPDALEVAADEAIAICDGDVRAALKAALVYNEFLERKIDMMRGAISTGYMRQRITPAGKAAEKVEQWREIVATARTSQGT
jgi:hypothetical protein